MAKEALGIKGLNAVLLSAADVAGMVVFYRDVLGLPLKVSDHGGGMHAEMDFPGLHFAIFPGGPRALERGPVTISLQVESVDAAYEQLKAAGTTFEEPPEDKPFGGRTALLRDPEGNGVYLMQWRG
jgi:uncharacterized glyoxalase superfamily protein PhnB